MPGRSRSTTEARHSVPLALPGAPPAQTDNRSALLPQSWDHLPMKLPGTPHQRDDADVSNANTPAIPLCAASQDQPDSRFVIAFENNPASSTPDLRSGLSPSRSPTQVYESWIQADHEFHEKETQASAIVTEKKCKKCNRVQPIAQYIWQDAFGREGERQNCATCRRKRRLSEQRRHNRERASCERTQEEKVRPAKAPRLRVESPSQSQEPPKDVNGFWMRLLQQLSASQQQQVFQFAMALAAQNVDPNNCNEVAVPMLTQPASAGEWELDSAFASEGIALESAALSATHHDAADSGSGWNMNNFPSDAALLEMWASTAREIGEPMSPYISGAFNAAEWQMPYQQEEDLDLDLAEADLGVDALPSQPTSRQEDPQSNVQFLS